MQSAGSEPELDALDRELHCARRRFFWIWVGGTVFTIVTLGTLILLR